MHVQQTSKHSDRDEAEMSLRAMSVQPQFVHGHVTEETGSTTRSVWQVTSVWECGDGGLQRGQRRVVLIVSSSR